MNPMKRLLMLLLVVALAAPVAAQAQSLSAVLNGANEVGGGDSDGVGFATVTVTGADSISYAVLVNNIGAPTAAHIHRGAAGTNGDPVVTLSPVAFGSVGVDASLLTEILANPSNFYVNVHTAEFPNGAVRGQLMAESGAEPGEVVSFLPVVGKVAGAQNTFFVSDIRIVNTSGAAAEVTLEWWPANPAGASVPAATVDLDVAAGQQLVLDDVVGSRFNTQGVGAVRVVSDRPVNVISRIINDQRPVNGGTTGFAFNAQSLAEADRSGLLAFLSNASDADRAAGLGFRTNIGYMNPNAEAVNLTLTARRSSDGSVLGSKTLFLPGLAIQGPANAFSVIDTVPTSDREQADFYVTYEASAPVLVYASVTDNRTGDGVFIQ
jgi:hypothetical protein